MDERLVYYLVGVPLLGVAAQWLAWRLRLPSILLLLAFGVGLGTYVRPDELLAAVAGADASVGPKLLFPFVSLSVAVILFEGGLTLRFRELRHAGGVVLRLVTIAALISWGLTTAAAYFLLHFDLRIAAIVGAVLVVTGPTVVGPMLRQIQPTRHMASIVKWEGIVIDPIGAVLAVLVFEFVVAPGGTADSLQEGAVLLLTTALIGLVVGAAISAVLIQCVKRYWIPDYLHGVTFLTAALAVYALSNALQAESGLVTVTVFGIIMANQKSIPVHHLLEFKEHLRVFLISCLFIVLGSRLEAGDLWNVGWRGALFLGLLIVAVRPISVFCSLLGTKLTWPERTFLAFLAPRGIVAAAVSSVFALELEHISHARELGIPAEQIQGIVAITFVVIIGTVFVYGITAGPIARRLSLAEPNPQGILFAGAEPWVQQLAKLLMESGQNVLLVDTNYANIAAAQMDGIPAECCSILSEHVTEELNLAGIGRLAAVTANDEVNAFAVQEYEHHFGRQNVYQLAPWDRGSGKRESVGEHLRGRILFDEQLDHDEIAWRIERGFTFKRTKLTDEFTYEQFRAMYGDKTLNLFLLDEQNQLRIGTMLVPLNPKSGHTLFALADLRERSDQEI